MALHLSRDRTPKVMEPEMVTAGTQKVMSNVHSLKRTLKDIPDLVATLQSLVVSTVVLVTLR